MRGERERERDREGDGEGERQRERQREIRVSGRWRSHVLSLLHVEQILALHGLLQQGAVLQHQALDLTEQVAVLLLQVTLQLAQELRTYTHANAHTNTQSE